MGARTKGRDLCSKQLLNLVGDDAALLQLVADLMQILVGKRQGK